MKISPRTALVLFVSIVVILFAQAVWWIVFMARLLDEKVEMANELGATGEFIDQLHQQEVSRQMMLGMEGIFFLILVLIGAWLIYRALVNAEEFQFRQQNFLMAVTHELKTPIASIRIYLDTLISPKVDAEKRGRIVPRMKDDIIRLEKMVENILEAGRFERHGYHLDRTEIDLGRLLNDALDDLNKFPIRQKLAITRDIHAPIEFHGDQRALRRAFDAILENCLKYNDNDEIKIEAKLSEIKSTLIILIRDNGIGLRKEDASAIFNRFFRVGEEINRSKPGSGLGLYLAREIIRAHGGNIVARSSGLGKGCEFEIKLEKDGRN